MRQDEEILRLLRKRANGRREVVISQGEMAALLGRSPAWVSERLSRLERRGEIRIQRTGRANIYILSDKGHELKDRNQISGNPDRVKSRKGWGDEGTSLGGSPQGNGENQILRGGESDVTASVRPSPAPTYGSPQGNGEHLMFRSAESEEPAKPKKPKLPYNPWERAKEGDPLYQYEDPQPIGRYKEEQLLENYLKKGLSVVVRGDEGVGKSVLVRQVARDAELLGYTPIYISRGSPTKEWLTALAQELVRRGLLQPQNFERIRNYLLADLCLDALRTGGEKWLLVFDHCDKLNSTQSLLLDQFLKRWTCVLVVSREKELNLALPEVELEPLSEEYQEGIVELFVEDEDLWVEDLKVFKRACVRRAKGNLKKLMAILQQAAVERNITCEWVHKELGFEKERDFIDATPAFLIAIAVIIGVRFLGLGLDDRELYVLAGLGYAAAWALRFFLWRWRKPTSQPT